jgi:hypothetical protein
MKDRDYERLSEWLNEGGALTPFNDIATDLVDLSKKGQIVTMLEVTDRNLAFHRCYFSLMNYIYDQLPKRFRQRVAKKNFYKYLKQLRGEFDIIVQFEHIVVIEYHSLSFSDMSQRQFEDYIREQLPWIYVKVIGKYYKVGGWRYNIKIESIEEKYMYFLSKL